MGFPDIGLDLNRWWTSAFQFFSSEKKDAKDPQTQTPEKSQPQPVDQYTADEAAKWAAAFPPPPAAATSTGWNPLAYSPFAIVTISGCGGEENKKYGGPQTYPSTGGGGSGGEGGGTVGQGGGTTTSTSTTNTTSMPIDGDGDGYQSDVDCDDSDPDAFPLKDNQVLSVIKSIRICPGTYKRVRINLDNVDGVKVNGANVVIDAGWAF